MDYHLKSNYIKQDAGSFNLNFIFNFEIPNKNYNFQREIQSDFKIPVRPVHQKKALVTFFVSVSHHYRC